MKRSAQIILHIGILMSILMLETVLLYMGCSVQGGEAFHVRIFPWALQVCAICLVNEWLSDRGLPVNVFLFINLLFCAASIYAGFLWIQAVPATTTVRIFQVVFSASLSMYSAYLTWEPEKPQTLIICFDVLIAFFLIYLFMDLVGILLPFAEFETAFLSMTAIVLLSMVLVRTSSGYETQAPTPSGILPVVALIAVCILTAAVFALLISGQVKGLTNALVLILTKLLMGFLYVTGFLFQLLGRFLEWLFHFLPDSEEAAMSMENVLAVPELDSAGEEISFSIPPALLFGALGVICLILLVLLFWHMRGKKLPKKKRRKGSGQLRRTSHCSAFLKNAFARFKENLKLRICLIRKRRTPSALVIRLEQYGQKNEISRLKGESVPAYLKRLAAHPSLSEKADFSAALTELSELVQQEYYSGAPVSLSLELYRRIRAGL